MKSNIFILFLIIVLSVFTHNSESQNEPTEGVYATVDVVAPSNSNKILQQSKKSNYCDCQGKSIAYGWIDQISIGEKTISSGSNSGYADFSDNELEIICGEFNSINILSGQAYNAERQNWRVWIDYNQDNEFGNDEQVLSNYAVDMNGLVYIPSRIRKSITTGMRVAMNTDDIPSPCGTFEHGEVEDYNVFLKVPNNRNSLLGNVDVNINKEIEKKNINVFPNPAKVGDNINAHIISAAEEEIQMNVFSIDGRLIFAGSHKLVKGTNKILIIDGVEESGVYLLKVGNMETTFIKKFSIIE